MVFSGVCVIVSAIMQAYALRTFLNPLHLLPGGFTGVAKLIELMTGMLGFAIPQAAGLLLLNVPVAAFCAKHIGKRFVFFSLMQVFLLSFFLTVFPEEPLFDDVLLNICFGGTVYGMASVLAFLGNASTGGTDFIALYVSNKIGKGIWQYVFIFNICMIFVFGAISDWEYAGYTILFQFINTKTIETFYHRYKRVTLQITTEHPEEVVRAYISNFRHGLSVMDGHGGYSGKKMSLLHSVISSYEVQDVVHVLKATDPQIIVNILPTENFVGRFYQKPIE
ncbi:MAG: YitT family protein [Lachnospiraceae bacterium]|nr:YitT family protein [Lachnospiraceae bacterium]